MFDIFYFAFKNTGQPATLTSMFMFMFFLPFCIMTGFAILKSFVKPKVIRQQRQSYEAPEFDTFTFASVTTTITETQAEQPTQKQTKEEQWQVIADVTMEKAMQGDKAARDWVTKHIFTDPVTPEPTGSPFISDAVDALKRAGYKPADVRKVANQLCSQNDYASLEDLIQDIVKNC